MINTILYRNTPAQNHIELTAACEQIHSKVRVLPIALQGVD